MHALATAVLLRTARESPTPGPQRLLGLVHGNQVDALIVAKLDRLTRSVKDP
jgi:DNA invertase Pin-like site-specific DNA recombinase